MRTIILCIALITSLFALQTIHAGEIRRIDKVGISNTAGNAITRHYLYNPAGFFKFDEGSGTIAEDSSGMGGSGALQGATIVSGVRGKGVWVNGNSGYVTIPHSDAIEFGADRDFTVALWVKTTQAAEAGKYPAILAKDLIGPPRWGYSFVLHDDLDVRWLFLIVANDNYYACFGAANIADGAWHHITGMRKGNKLYVYQDGLLVTSIPATTASVATGTALQMGKVPKAPPQAWSYFTGSIDDVRIFGRALTDDEVIRLYYLRQ